jgi:hypothetical protein
MRLGAPAKPIIEVSPNLAEHDSRSVPISRFAAASLDESITFGRVSIRPSSRAGQSPTHS